MQGITFQTVHDIALQCFSMNAAVAQDEHVVAGDAENVGGGAFHGDLFDKVKTAVAVEHFDGVALIPVASHHDAPAVYFYAGGQRAFGVKTTESPKCVGFRVVFLHRKSLPNAQWFLVASSQEHLARGKPDADAVVVRVGRLHQMPFAVFIVFGCCRRDKVGGMPSHHR